MTDGMIATRAWLERRRAARGDATLTGRLPDASSPDKLVRGHEAEAKECEVKAEAAAKSGDERMAKYWRKLAADQRKYAAQAKSRGDADDPPARMTNGMRSFEKGRDAAKRGKPKSSNPHGIRESVYERWNEGWEKGKEEMKSGRGDAINDFRPGDMVRLTNPDAKPTYRILGMTDTHYQIDRPDEKSWNGGKPAMIDKKRIHRVNGRSDAARSDARVEETSIYRITYLAEKRLKDGTMAQLEQIFDKHLNKDVGFRVQAGRGAVYGFNSKNEAQAMFDKIVRNNT